jgi:hypothetical protein
LRPQPTDDKGIRTRPALHIALAFAEPVPRSAASAQNDGDHESDRT